MLKCPTEVSPLLVEGEDDIRGCGSERVFFDPEDQGYVCPDCGLFFSPESVDPLAGKDQQWFIEQYNENSNQE